MQVKLLYTLGQNRFEEMIWTKPEPSDDEIEVQAVMTGICRSDIDMMQGNFGPLPLHMQGHEGLGVVTKVGANITGVKVGDYVATRGEPAYADYYNCRNNEFVTVDELAPKYIIEPVACGINCIEQAYCEIERRRFGKALILGSGFLAWVAYTHLKLEFSNLTIDVLGNSNKEIWQNQLLDSPNLDYDIVLDLSGKYELGSYIQLNNNAIIIDAVGKAVTKQEAQTQLWKACTTIRPSPRTDGFIESMILARNLIKNGNLDVDYFWTKGYNRHSEWQQAFADGVTRPANYSRGYIYWNH